MLLFIAALLMLFHPAEASIKAIVFDCDGVLVDTEELKYQAWKQALEPSGINLSLERYQSLIGNTGLFILNSLDEEYQIDLSPKIVEEKNAIYWSLQKNGLKSIGPMLAVVNWAVAMKSNNRMLLGVASSSSKAEVLFNLKYLNLHEQFDMILSGKEDLIHYHDPLGVNKPRPYIYSEMCKQLNIKPEECLVIEDSESGVCAAKSAGCWVIAVPTKWTNKQNFEKADLALYNYDANILIDEIQKIIQG